MRTSARVIEKALRQRPRPDDELLDPGNPLELFRPAPEILAWCQTNLIGDGPLYNPEHDHLLQASIGFLWTNVALTRNGKRIAGMAEIPQVQGNAWVRARAEQQLREWFGEIDFLITLSAGYAASVEDARWCALCEHELLHCGQKVGAFGEPMFTITGKPRWGIVGHDVEQFVSIVARYGADAADVRALVEAANRPPSIAPALIEAACGVCIR